MVLLDSLKAPLGKTVTPMSHNIENNSNTYVPGWDGGKENITVHLEINTHDLAAGSKPL